MLPAPAPTLPGRCAKPNYQVVVVSRRQAFRPVTEEGANLVVTRDGLDVADGQRRGGVDRHHELGTGFQLGQRVDRQGLPILYRLGVLALQARDKLPASVIDPQKGRDNREGRNVGPGELGGDRTLSADRRKQGHGSHEHQEDSARAAPEEIRHPAVEARPAQESLQAGQVPARWSA
jgi:hypothetical protein